MGLFDTVHVDQRILEDNKISCPRCKASATTEFQTKDFHNAMDSYYLRYDDERIARLYSLDEPDDKRFWHDYTPEEIQKMRDEEKGKNRALFKGLHNMWIKNGGHWTEEAYLPQNRYQRNMGELPHQICRFYNNCASCAKSWKDGSSPKPWIEIEVKFTDGVVVSVVQKEEIDD